MVTDEEAAQAAKTSGSGRREEPMTADIDTSRSQFRELAHRENDGVEVVLFWHELTSKLTVSVSDVRSGRYFELAAAPEDALDVFNHPYAFAAFRGVSYDDTLLPTCAQAAAAIGGRNDIEQLPEPTR
jgi:hypothetical protein